MDMRPPAINSERALRLWKAIAGLSEDILVRSEAGLTESQRIARARLFRAFREITGYDPRFIDTDINGDPVQAEWTMAVQWGARQSNAPE